MRKVVGIRFKPAGKVYDFECGAFVLNKGDCVIVQTEQGLGFGVVVVGPAPLEDGSRAKNLKKVYRMAGDKDFTQLQKNLEDEKKAHAYCVKCIKQLELQMNLFCVEKAFDGSKYTFFFTADGRVDFRQLVKMLVKELGVRIEMRQVGIRHQAKMCGGIGRCGRETCCSAFLEKFGPVSIRMAKEQNLSLNPTKISGQCGRLMCCLTYEYDTYRKMKKDFPKIGRTIKTAAGEGKIVRHNILAGILTIRLEDDKEVEVPLEEALQGKETPKPNN
jgi:cell fate regulator YaaT (PSP1 superfamily)